MSNDLSKKLKIKEGYTLLTINAPADFRKKLDIPGIKTTTSAKSYHQLHWFVKTAAQVKKEAEKIRVLLKENIICWIYYPKSSSGMQTDLSRDKGWGPFQSEEFQWLSLVSFDEVWSAFAIRLKSATAEKPKGGEPNEIAKFIDPVSKSVQIPVDFEKELKKNKPEFQYFSALAFSHKKEYVLWIISAKKEETRAKRITESIEKLKKQWKNPSNN